MPVAPHRLRAVLAVGIYEPDNGGASEWLRHYARWLLGRGHDVSIVCEQAKTDESFPVLTLPTSHHTKNSWKRAKALQELADAQQADLVHDTGCLLAADILHPLMGSLTHNWRRQLRAYPLTLRVRRFWHVRLWRDVRLQRHQLRQRPTLVACSKRVATDFADLGFNNVVIIPNGIALPTPSSVEKIQQLRQMLAIGDRLLVLATATNFYLKGVLTIFRALCRLNLDARKKFLVIITGNDRLDKFQQYIRQHGLSDCCRMAGWVDNIDDYYHAADVFLHPTYHDAGSLSTLKALANGRAVVTSRFDGSADWIRHGVNGLILNNPDNADELADIMLRLQDAGLRAQLGNAAGQLAPALDQEHQFRKLEALYFETLGKKQ